MKYAMDYHIVPVLSSTSSTAAINTQFVDLGENLWVDFVIYHAQQDTATITVVQCPASSTTGSTIDQVPFVYRSSSAIGTDSLGAATTASTAGYSHSTVDGVEVISVNPADLGDGYKFVRVAVAANAAAAVRSGFAILYPRKAQATNVSSS